MKTPADKTAWIKDNRCRADDAIRALQAAKKQVTSEYDERLRKLKDFAEILFIKQADEAQGEMFDMKELLPADLESLLSAPLHGLD